VRWAENVALMNAGETLSKFWSESKKWKYHLKDKGINEIVVLKSRIKEWN
jgi:hypothetical protein